MGCSGMSGRVGLAMVAPIKTTTIPFHNFRSLGGFPVIARSSGRSTLVPSRTFSSIAGISLVCTLTPLGAKVRAGGVGSLVGTAVCPVIGRTTDMTVSGFGFGTRDNLS